jgi:hypothetical protein
MPLPPVTEVAVAQEGLQVLRLERAPVHLVRGVAGQEAGEKTFFLKDII